MAVFTHFNNRLPDPTFFVNEAGVVDSSGSKGPGFAGVTFRSNRPAQVSKTISGRGVHRETGSHNWEFDIKYHPMKRDDFEVIQAFLDSRNGRLNPFYVVLPQHSRPKDSVFSAFVSANTMTAAGAHSAGSTKVMMQAAVPIPGTAKPGDFFTITDVNDITHQKAYKVTAVETNATYQQGTTRPSTSQIRVHVLPPLTKFVAANSVINWIDPKFRVIQKGDTQEYDLNTDNLYQYGLSLEEIQP